jgi:hypothetical protein
LGFNGLVEFARFCWVLIFYGVANFFGIFAGLDDGFGEGKGRRQGVGGREISVSRFFLMFG